MYLPCTVHVNVGLYNINMIINVYKIVHHPLPKNVFNSIAIQFQITLAVLLSLTCADKDALIVKSEFVSRFVKIKD